MTFSKARTIARIFLLGSSLLTKALVRPHGVSVRYCHTTDGMLRIFVEHWHCFGEENKSPDCDNDQRPELTSAAQAGTMDIRDDTDGIGIKPTEELTPAGFIKFQDDREFGLPGCDGDGRSTLANSCNDETTNAWVYYDFPLICDKQIKYTFLKGNSYYLVDGCDKKLYNGKEGLTITGTFKDESQPNIYVNGKLCDENTVIYRQTDDPSRDEAVVDYSYYAKDDCKTEKEIDVTVSPEDKDSGSTFKLGSTSVTITANDKVQTPATCTFQVVVETGTHVPSVQPSASPSKSFGKKKCSVWPGKKFVTLFCLTTRYIKY